MTKPIHIEMYDSNTFCGFDPLPSTGHGCIDQVKWHREPEVIQQATCPECLLRCFMIGDSAQIALKRMGLQAQAIDASEEPS